MIDDLDLVALVVHVHAWPDGIGEADTARELRSSCARAHQMGREGERVVTSTA